MSDTPFRTSGFGLVTAEVCKRLAYLGHEILVLGWWSAAEAKFAGRDVQPCPVNPTGATAAIVKHVGDFHPDYLITLGDVPWLSFVANPEIQSCLSDAGVKWFIYYPVDGVLSNGGLPLEWINVISKADVAITMSDFGLVATEQSGIQAVLIPHGCDTDLFRPPEDKDAAKYRLGYRGKFVVLSDARNHRRKLIPRILDIVSGLRIPSRELIFHLHTNAVPQEDAESYRYNVFADLSLLRLNFVTGPLSGAPLSMTEMAALYAAADVYLLGSFGEGFGLPTLQAASSGVVPVVPANSASTELAGSHGFAIPCDFAARDEFGILRPFINRQDATLALQNLYSNPDLLRTRSANARAFALKYSWDKIAASWDALIRAKRAHSRRSTSSFVRSIHGSSESHIRPTGHSSSILPIPLIGVPARLEIRREPKLALAPALLLVERSFVDQLHVLEDVFPGVHVEELDATRLPTGMDLYRFIARATLVVDPESNVRPRLDAICAMCGVNFLGKSGLWPPATGTRLVLQARNLLTDYAFSQARLLNGPSTR